MSGTDVVEGSLDVDDKVPVSHHDEDKVHLNKALRENRRQCLGLDQEMVRFWRLCQIRESRRQSLDQELLLFLASLSAKRRLKVFKI